MKTLGLLASQAIVIGLVTYFVGSFVIRRNAELVAPHLRFFVSAETIVQDYVKSPKIIWTSIPDPMSGRIARYNQKTTRSLANIVINNVGFRSKKSFRSKPEHTFRVVCLGDSFVFGAGGKEEDRFCDQMEEYYASRNITVSGKRIEMMAFGLGSWTMSQEASYLSRRLTDIDPDAILVLSVANDVTPSTGLNGDGRLSQAHSIDARSLGSGVYSYRAGDQIKKKSPFSILTTNFCVACREQWIKSITELTNLVRLQKKRGKHILLSVMGPYSRHFNSFYLWALGQVGFVGPVLETGFNHLRLPHDSHPSREGHAILANRYIHQLSESKIIPVQDSELPTLPSPNLLTQIPGNFSERFRKLNRRTNRIPSELNFDDLHKKNVWVLLGGMLALKKDGDIWGTNRSGFVLRSSHPNKMLQLNISLVNKMELYPLTLKIDINGKALWSKTFKYDEIGKVEINVPVPSELVQNGIVQVEMFADSHFSTMLVHYMRSYLWHSAKLTSAPLLYSRNEL